MVQRQKRVFKRDLFPVHSYKFFVQRHFVFSQEQKKPVQISPGLFHKFAGVLRGCAGFVESNKKIAQKYNFCSQKQKVYAAEHMKDAARHMRDSALHMRKCFLAKGAVFPEINCSAERMRDSALHMKDSALHMRDFFLHMKDSARYMRRFLK